MQRRSLLLGLAGAAFSGTPLAKAAAQSFPEGLVSLTYDDGLDTQLDRAVPALNERGLRGTFYVTWENIEERAGDWQIVAQAGHELANHTMTHPCGIRSWSPSRYRRQLEPLEQRLAQWEPGLPSRDFSYPCDVTDLGPGNPNVELRRFKRLLRAEGLNSARTSEGPPNSLNWASRNPYRLQALAAGYDAPTLDELVAYIRRAQREHKWAILVFHDVDPGAGRGSISPDIHDAVLDTIIRERITCRRVCDVMKGLAPPLTR